MENYYIYIITLNAAVLILFIIILIRMLKAKEKHLHQQEEILQYESNLTEIYDMMRIFRHDYKNTIVALKGCYNEQNYDEIGEILNSITEDFAKIDNYHQMNVVSQLEDSALKWLLISKMSVAQKKGIVISLLISNKIEYGSLKAYEISRIVGNLLDNAIEAAEESERRQIKIGLFSKSKDTIISVKNTYKDRPLPEEILKKGNTGKVGHSGYGLYGVKKIIEKHNDVLMDIRVNDDYFSIDINITNV